jgi:hypothetical protein
MAEQFRASGAGDVFAFWGTFKRECRRCGRFVPPYYLSGDPEQCYDCLAAVPMMIDLEVAALLARGRRRRHSYRFHQGMRP